MYDIVNSSKYGITCKATASSYNEAYYPQNALIYNSDENAWQAKQEKYPWWQIEFSKPVRFEKYILLLEYLPNFVDFPYAWYAEASNDGKTWEKVDTRDIYSDPREWMDEMDFVLSKPVNCKYFKLTFTESNNDETEPPGGGAYFYYFGALTRDVQHTLTVIDKTSSTTDIFVENTKVSNSLTVQEIQPFSKTVYATNSFCKREKVGTYEGTESGNTVTIEDRHLPLACMEPYQLTIRNPDNVENIYAKDGNSYTQITSTTPFNKKDLNKGFTIYVYVKNDKCPDYIEIGKYECTSRKAYDYNIDKSKVPEKCRPYEVYIHKEKFDGNVIVKYESSSTILNDNSVVDYHKGLFIDFSVNVFIRNNYCTTETPLKTIKAKTEKYINNIAEKDIPEICIPYSVYIIFPNDNKEFYIDDKDKLIAHNGVYNIFSNAPFEVNIYYKGKFCMTYQLINTVKAQRNPDHYVVTSDSIPKECLFTKKIQFYVDLKKILKCISFLMLAYEI